MSKAKDTLTVSDEQPPKMVQIFKESDPPGFGDSAWLPETDVEHWLAEGWSVVD